MPRYLIETCLARGHGRERTTRGARARSAAEWQSRAGKNVRFQRASHLPEDEICFIVFHALRAGTPRMVRPEERSEPCPFIP